MFLFLMLFHLCYVLDFVVKQNKFNSIQHEDSFSETENH